MNIWLNCYLIFSVSFRIYVEHPLAGRRSVRHGDGPGRGGVLDDLQLSLRQLGLGCQTVQRSRGCRQQEKQIRPVSCRFYKLLMLSLFSKLLSFLWSLIVTLFWRFIFISLWCCHSSQSCYRRCVIIWKVLLLRGRRNNKLVGRFEIGIISDQ